MCTMNHSAELDVREIPVKDKHPRIFEVYGQLKTGQSMMLINDHDPKPLKYQFEAEHSGEFQWEYLEQGPDIWRVNITKI